MTTVPEPVLVSDCCGAPVRPVGVCDGCGEPCDGTSRMPVPDGAVTAAAWAIHRERVYHPGPGHICTCKTLPAWDMRVAEAALEAAAPAIRAQGAAAERALLTKAADALWACAKAALTVKPNLDTPYPDAPDWTPWTRWMERPARQAHDLRMKIRKHLKADLLDGDGDPPARTPAGGSDD